MLELSHGGVSLLALFTSNFLLCWFPETIVSEEKKKNRHWGVSKNILF